MDPLVVCFGVLIVLSAMLVAFKRRSAFLTGIAASELMLVRAASDPDLRILAPLGLCWLVVNLLSLRHPEWRKEPWI